MQRGGPGRGGGPGRDAEEVAHEPSLRCRGVTETGGSGHGLLTGGQDPAAAQPASGDEPSESVD